MHRCVQWFSTDEMFCESYDVVICYCCIMSARDLSQTFGRHYPLPSPRLDRCVLRATWRKLIIIWLLSA